MDEIRGGSIGKDREWRTSCRARNWVLLKPGAWENCCQLSASGSSEAGGPRNQRSMHHNIRNDGSSSRRDGRSSRESSSYVSCRSDQWPSIRTLGFPGGPVSKALACGGSHSPSSRSHGSTSSCSSPVHHIVAFLVRRPCKICFATSGGLPATAQLAPAHCRSRRPRRRLSCPRPPSSALSWTNLAAKVSVNACYRRNTLTNHAPRQQGEHQVLPYRHGPPLMRGPRRRTRTARQRPVREPRDRRLHQIGCLRCSAHCRWGLGSPRCASISPSTRSRGLARGGLSESWLVHEVVRRLLRSSQDRP